MAVAVKIETAVAWTLVRCPRCHDVLGEVEGVDARLRKVCRGCKPRQCVVYEHASGRFVLEPVAAGVTSTAHGTGSVL